MQCLHVSKRKKPMREHIVNLCHTCYQTAHDPNEQGGCCMKNMGLRRRKKGNSGRGNCITEVQNSGITERCQIVGRGALNGKNNEFNLVQIKLS